MSTTNNINSKRKAILLLADGSRYEGTAIGKIGIAGGEICFNTGMTGYQEIYTDPSYYGQIVVNTTSHIGNYGVEDDEQESDSPKIRGLVVNDFSNDYSRKTADGSLQDYLEKNNIVGISDVDTRLLVRYIRDKGAMNAIICSEDLSDDELKAKVAEIPSMDGLELSSYVSTKEPYFVGDENADIKIAVLDIGVKTSILKHLASRGAYLKVFNAKTTFEEMSEWNPDGYFLSNGPGDPAAMPYAVETAQKIMEEDKPLFGICLGHQVIALACGATTFKMHNGHRGLNHPVKNLISGKSEITSQNHGFAVDLTTLKEAGSMELTHINLNDDTVAGLQVKGKKTFSVQYHPESSPGPHDSRYLFDQFINLIKS
ncbi:carbamoyl phosphate synthase small subunit [Roseivirga seohaensis subsp. aquiponti]|uniref:Carbamoyl phosphate synthase small chain n=1 Tax=Roseivirga seohaensis subsp. aquiponti TaxID=1566026 RepID=A0A0L8AMI9_9BACT|nr:glutamine-hydrolyzing carbamoyl-phosphate synthase small subunit [Roseivirga seohaensis]KOF03539.1 carbamoyl phosphate synthase small subunit [Roseivirga seohaensis subsp. aquiponti]